MIALFPGQGAQFVGMGKDALKNFPIARETFEEASNAISFDLKKICLDGPESDLKLTENTQPALLTVSTALYRIASKEFGIIPKLVAGHSLGEYSALVAAEVFPFASAVQWVRARGRAMQEAVPPGEGGMAAVMGLEDSQVQTLCQRATEKAKQISDQEIVEPANFNSPGQVVVSGTVGAISQLSEIVKSEPLLTRAKIKVLPVSAPFHCRLMKPAAQKMKEIFEQSGASPKKPKIPYISNRKAIVTEGTDQIITHLIEQIDHPVLWTTSIQNGFIHGETMGIEFGPGRVLQGLLKRIARSQGIEVTTQGVHDLDSIKALENLK